MAVRPADLYPSQIQSGDPAYPHGKAQNVTNPGDGTGTPLEKQWLNDVWGFLQNLLERAGISPSGSPDSADASQYYDALERMRRLEAVLNWTARQAIPDISGQINAYVYELEEAAHIITTWGGNGQVDVAISSDGGRTWGTSDLGTAALRDLDTHGKSGLGSGTSDKVLAVGDGGQVWAWDGSTWSDVSPSTNENFRAVVRHQATTWYLFGSADVVYHTGTASGGWSSTALPTTDTIVDAASNGSDVVAVDQAGRVLRLSSGWAQDTVNSAPSSFVAVAGSEETGTFLAIGDGKVYKNDPGDTDWNQVHDHGTVILYDIACDGRGLWVLVGSGIGNGLLYSTDEGTTWNPVLANVVTGYYADFAGGAFFVTTDTDNEYVRTPFMLDGHTY